MPVLKFKADGLRRVVEHTLAATAWRETYGQPPVEGVLLVGDRGVYLMSGADPGDTLEDGKDGLYVCYAEGINPAVDEFDDWYDRKRAMFGGDDFVEALPWASLMQTDIWSGAAFISLKVNKKSMSYIGGSM